MKTSIAILITCHNRKDKTLNCLKALFNSQQINNIVLEVFLVDDGSTDGTSDLILENFPTVHIYYGNGSLFWNQGMRLAWEKATEYGHFDYFLWLNDDTVVDPDALFKMLEMDTYARSMNQMRLITAACRASDLSDEFSYGGRTDQGKVTPNGKIQECKYVNGNLVLVPQYLYKKLGNLSPHYTHGIGDNDYGLRCIELGGKCFTTPTFLATCPPNEGVPGWCDPKVSFKRRWQLLHSPKGLNIKEYNLFRKRFWGRKWIIFAFKAYLKTILPGFYEKIAKS